MDTPRERSSDDPPPPGNGGDTPAKKPRRRSKRHGPKAPAGPSDRSAPRGGKGSPGKKGKAAAKGTSPRKGARPHEGRTDRSAPKRLGERAPGIYRGLALWIEERLAEEFGDDLPPPGTARGSDDFPDHFELTLRLPFVRDPRRWRKSERAFRTALENQLDALCDQLRTDRLGYRDGHLFCPWCASPICEHSVPPDPRMVFVGYNPTGVPLWRDLGSWLLERGDERVDRLYRDRPLPLAVRVEGDELTAEMLPEFAEAMRPLSVAGALVAGYFSIPRPGGGEQAIALTALALERRTASGAPRYALNLIAHLPPPHHLPTLLAERVVPILSDWIATLRHELSRVHERWIEERRGGRRLSVGECRALVDRALENGALYLEKRLRRRQGRTDHAEERATDPERPTASALSDALGASADAIFHDRKERTVIVRGPRNRVHVFRADGTLITSILYTGDSIRDRIASGRWVPLEKQRIEALRRGITDRRSLGDAESGTAGGEA